MVELTIEYLQLEGVQCSMSYFAIYEMRSLRAESMIKHFQCVKTPIRNQVYLSDWNTMSVVWHRHPAQYPDYDIIPTMAVLALYRGQLLHSYDDEQGRSIY